MLYVYPRSRCESSLFSSIFSTSDARGREKVSGVLLGYRYLFVTAKSARDLDVTGE